MGISPSIWYSGSWWNPSPPLDRGAWAGHAVRQCFIYHNEVGEVRIELTEGLYFPRTRRMHQTTSSDTLSRLRRFYFRVVVEGWLAGAFSIPPFYCKLRAILRWGMSYNCHASTSLGFRGRDGIRTRTAFGQGSVL